MIGIVNYGLGNIQAFANIYKRLNIDSGIASSSDDLKDVTGIILPGVGAFDWAMARLNKSGMREVLDDLVMHQKKPVIGICVGMQMMANGSDEGELEGLGWIDAEVKKFDRSKFDQKILLPHMGWNNVNPQGQDLLFNDLQIAARFYFLHSYYFVPHNPENVLAVTDYHSSFASAVRSENVFGVQFHPEKSHHWGIQLLENFAEIASC